MANYVNITNDGITLNTEWDNIRITDVIETKVGGAVLDTTDFSDTVIESGHVVIHNAETDTFRPMPLTTAQDGAKSYGTLPSGFTYYGFVIASVLTKQPAVGILTRGRVNPAAFKYSIATIESALKTALPHITFVTD